MYETETKALNVAVKRNLKRFPVDFMFQLLQQPNLERSKKVALWIAIAENRLGEAFKRIAEDPAAKRSGIWPFGKAKTAYPTSDLVLKAAWMIMSDKAADDLELPGINLKTAGDDFPEWIRMCWVLQRTGILRV
ncbi:ORF6N domain-containing protein [Flavitalea sp. BT771]|uniref:ORF6N domain-containing protein n=1 Tax=Flavitalea sp. BT771 TaxID=3063329 RepID=UPI0026E14E94|nr:ORF6N domain-containing protein [Flavitalea sp. BT771]MDO6429430.1 ORF6N domain-containing protein [Flavitalea sp. BT771]